MNPSWRRLAIALSLAVLAPLAASAQANFFFIHVPPTSSGTSVDQVVSGLQDIGQILEDNWALGHPDSGPPKICWVGFAGPWKPGGPTEPNLAGNAANRLGNASPNDNQEGTAVSIDYCAISIVLDELLAKCDIVIALGEGADNSFNLEEHGDPNNPPEPDCGGNTPGGPVCGGGGCTGTDWGEPSYCLCATPTFSELVVCSYNDQHADDRPGSYIPVKPGTGAGNFLCGYTCCGAHQIY